MLSLENAFEEQDVRDFFAGVRNFFRRTATEALVAEDKIAIMAEPKIDGLSIALTYRDGRLALDPLVTHRFPLGGVHKAIETTASGAASAIPA